MSLIVTITGAPRWAEGSRRPRAAPPGSWSPDPAALAGFARAAARRYSGRFPDPLRPGRRLPAVRRWQIWNEPNLPVHLSPQYVKRRGRWQQAAAPHYRLMLNASYQAIKSVSRRNVVVSAGTAPYGDFSRGTYARTMPLAFWRSLLCLNDRLRPLPCPHPVRLDVAAHHPYAINGPFQHAYNHDDLAVPDLGRLQQALGAARRYRRVLPTTQKRLWVTEISWDSKPPDPYGVPEQRRARWLEESFYELWHQGVDTITWFQIRDQLPKPSYAATYQSGTYFHDGRPKLAAQAFRFPFVARWTRRPRALVWLRAPDRGLLVVERRRGRRWVAIHRAPVRTEQVLALRMALRGMPTLRGRIGKTRSLPYRVR